MSASRYKFDVALSFAGEQRDYVDKVYNELQKYGINAYYDEVFEVENWGRNLVDHFSDIFKNQARHCVMFISNEYADKVWTEYERQVAQSRDLLENDYILPVRFDNTDVQGLVSTKAYINASENTPEQLAEKIAKKVSESTDTTDIEKTNQSSYKQPDLPPKNFNPYKAREQWLNEVLDEIETRDVSEVADITVIRNSSNTGIRVVLDGKLIYAIDFQFGGLGSDSGIALSTGRGTAPTSGFNAWGDFEWDKTKQEAVLMLSDLGAFQQSLSSTKPESYTSTEFIELLWNTIVDSIEKEHE